MRDSRVRPCSSASAFALVIAAATLSLSAAPPENARRHPLISAVDKDAYNAWTELQSALASGADEDACRIVTSLNENALRGLLPDAEDRDLFLSFPIVIERILETHPSFARTMIEKFEPIGLIRVRAAIDRRDETGLKMAIQQFPGTEAAREAQTWIGDEMLSLGRFREAEYRFQKALVNAKPSHREGLSSRLLLAQTLAGRLSNFSRLDRSLFDGKKFDLNGTLVTESDFDVMIEGILKHQTAARQIDAGSSAIPIGNYSLVRRTELELPSLAQTQPQLADERLFVTRQNHSARQVVCFNSSDGRVSWTTRSAVRALNDPKIWNQRLIVATLTKQEDEQFQISAAWIDRATGSVESLRPLFQLRESAESGDLSVEDWYAVLSASGTICCFAWNGETQWVRRLNPSKSTEAVPSDTPRPSQKLNSDGTVIVVREESNQIDCLSVTNGHMKWRQTVTDVLRLVAVSESRIILQTTSGLVALDADSGQAAWQYVAQSQVESIADDGTTLVVRSAFGGGQDSADPLKRRLVWMDLKSGDLKGNSILNLPNVDQPRLGPLFSGGGKWWVILDHSKGSTLFSVD